MKPEFRLSNGDSFCAVSFAEKVRIFSNDYLKCCIYISDFSAPQYLFTKNLYSKLISVSQLLEDLLDFHGAKNNSNWYFYRELSASIRHLSIASYSQKHILNRISFYDLPDSEAFQKDGEITLNFLTSSLANMAPVILNEARRLHISVPKERFGPADFPGIVTGEMLACDIYDNEGRIDEQRKNIVRIANEFLNVAAHFEQFEFFEPYNPQKMLELVPERINEVEIRRYEMLVHNLQSYFDTYILLGGFNDCKKKLKFFRSFFSVVFHLLQMMGRLLHYYERHLYESGYKNAYKKVQERMCRIVNPEMLLDRTVNYGLYYVCHYLSAGKKLAEEILNENIERSSVKVGIPMKLGFHCRPSLLVAKIVQFYGGQVSLCVGTDRFDASSVLDIQWAGGKIQKENITEVTFEGDARALKDIRVLAGVNYCEDAMGKGLPFPKELKYLKE
ncbi:MAG: phosphotransferase [Desulfobacteraceae bacterium IS3]|nr:MAG: phosphotransferase [Desulfobacteraceae bacterium IS3]